VEAFLLILAGGAVSEGTGLLADLLKRRWDRDADRRRRLDESSEEAANDLYPVLDEVNDAFAPHAG
jgi:hypothetical protein